MTAETIQPHRRKPQAKFCTTHKPFAYFTKNVSLIAQNIERQSNLV